jgi:hypothetical protein
MNSEYLNKQWWFMLPVVGTTIASVFWLFSALGLGKPFELFTFPGVLLVVISGFSFHRFYFCILWAVLWRVSPAIVAEKKVSL